MTDQHVNWLLTLVSVWTIGILPLVLFHAAHKFMEVMRRTKDNEPW